VDERLEQIRVIAADVLEVEPEEIIDDANFAAQYDADSMRAIEILSRIEKKFQIEIPQRELPNMHSLTAAYAVVRRYAGE
jgi:acyl carrier protein